MPQQDYYAILGVERDADVSEIKRAYRRLALDCHPDRFPGDEAAAHRFRQVSEAYAVLSDPQKRTRFDRGAWATELTDLAANPSVGTAKDLFRSVFGDFFGARKKERRRGRDVRYTLSLTLREAVLGCTKSIEFEALTACERCDGRGFEPGGRPPQTCDLCDGRGELRRGGLLPRRTACGRCDGTGMLQVDACTQCRGRGSLRARREFSVRIPPGSESGAERLIKGQGEPGRFGGDPGQLRVTLNVRNDPYLQRVGQDIHCDLPLSPVDLALGTTVTVPTVDGRATVQVPAGLQSGARLRLRGLGVPDGRGDRGDEIVIVRAETPVALSSEQKEVLAGVASLLRPENLPQSTALRTEMKRSSAESSTPQGNAPAES